MLNKNYSYSLSIKLFLLSIMFLPWDSFPITRISTYSPISLFLLLIPIFCTLYNVIKSGKIAKVAIILVLIYLYGLSISWYRGVINNDFQGFYYFFISFLIGILAFYCSLYFFSRIKNMFSNIEDFIDFIFEWYVKLVPILIILGFLELLTISGFFPVSIMYNISQFLTGHFRGDRIQLLSYEPSWAARNLLMLLPIMIYLYKKKKYALKYILCTILLILTTFSFEAIAIILTTIIIYICLDRNKIKTIIKIIFLITLGFLMLYIIINIWGNIIGTNSYFINRFEKILNLTSFRELIVMDASTMIRILHPIIAILMFIKYPLLGVGGGNYTLYYFEVLQESIIDKFPEFLLYSETYNAYVTQSGNSKCLYTRLIGELGLVGIVLIIIFILIIFYRFNYLKIENKKLFNICIIVILATGIQFDSYNYLNIWVILAFVYSLKICKFK